MSTIQKIDGAFAKYMAFIHVTEVNLTDFDELIRQVRDEGYQYEAALEEAYALQGVLNTKKRETALAMLDETHNKFIKQAKDAVDAYVGCYKETRNEWTKLLPNYKWDIKEYDYNKSEFHRFCNEFAGKYGGWFWEIQLRHDPLDDMCYGYATIRELQNVEDANWYPGMEDWKCIPYGARLLKYNLDGLPDWHGDPSWIDLTWRIMVHQNKYKCKPGPELLKTLKIDPSK
ncbi:MAG: hypothetical protein IKE91_08320 [Clostridia bacterium]|nr:hypothetical protein [Clostridia bacterium]